MNQVCAGQIKAARAVLDWSREDLACATGLSINTIRNLEMGYISPRGKTTRVIREAIENAGIEFTESEGIKRRTDDIKVLHGKNSQDLLLEDMIRTVKTRCNEIIAIFKSQKLMMKSFGLVNSSALDLFTHLNIIARIKCLVSETPETLPSLSAFEFRTMPKHYLGPLPYLVYGDKHALVLQEANENFRFVIFRSMHLTQSYRGHFAELWDAAPQ